MTRPRYRKYPVLQEELRRTRISVMRSFGTTIPKAVKEAHLELFVSPQNVPLSEQGIQGRRKRSMVEGDPTAEAADWRKGQGTRRKSFDRAIWMLTGGLEKQIQDALDLLNGITNETKTKPEGQTDVYQLVDKASPTIGAYSQRQHAKLIARNADRQEWLEGQDNWKAAGIE